MKKIIFSILLITLFTTIGYANQFRLDSLGFIAPTIIGKSNVYHPAVGEIIYDQTDGTFYGNNHNDQWQPLNGGNGGGSPTGSITAFGGTSAPAGYLICDGSEVSRETYSNLFDVIGTSFGAGDGSTTFNLPDLRGRFLRGVDNGAGNDPDSSSRSAMNIGGNSGDNVGSVQNDTFQGHFHSARGRTAEAWQSGGALAANLVDNAGGNLDTTRHTGSPSTDGTHGTPRTSSETRPVNAGVNFIIKI